MNWFESEGKNATNDTELGYKKGKPAVLDHLVPLTERREDVPAVLLQDESDVNHEELACVRNAWQQATDRASEAQELWGPRVHHQFERDFAQVVREQTPNAEDAEKRRGILQAIDDIAQTGLPDYPGLCIRPYGSYVSGLYCPSGDLDLSIEGTPTGGPAEGLSVKSISKGGKADLLRTVSKKLERRRLHTGWIERILHARVPILKFTIQGVDCDVSIGSSNAIFKAKAFKALASRERRFRDMLRLVKAWAGAHGLNDAADGTFNSFALGLMLIFHLQTCEPPVLPPLHELFQDSCSAIASRPIHMGKDINWDMLDVFQGCAETRPVSSNAQGLAQLMSAFFNCFHAALLVWRDDEEAASVRASTWCGRWSYGHWEKTYVAAVEDPFDATDNCARTIGFSRIDSIVEAFGRAAGVMNAARDDMDVQKAMAYLFKGILPPQLPLVPTIELRLSDGQRKEKALAREAEGRRWRQRTYARDNRALPRRRDSGTGADGIPSPAGASPAAPAAPMRLPKFARQLQGAGEAVSPAPQSNQHHRLVVPAFTVTSPAPDSRGLNGFAHQCHPANSPYNGSPALAPMGPRTGMYPDGEPAQTASANRPGRRIAGPSQRPAASYSPAPLPTQLPSQSLAQSGVAELAMSSPGVPQSVGSQQAPRRPPPGFGSRSGFLEAYPSPGPAGNQDMSSHAAGSYGQPNQAPSAYHEALHALTDRHTAAATTHAMPDRQPQTVSHRMISDSGSPLDAAQHRPNPPVPYYMPAQQVAFGGAIPLSMEQTNQALSDQLRRLLNIGQSPASEVAPAAQSASEHDHTADDSALDSSAFALKGRRSHRARRPAKHAEQGAAQSQGGDAANPHGSAAAAPDTATDTPGKPKRFLKARRQGNPHGQPLHQALPVRSAAEAFVENNLSANAAQRKPKKVIPVTVR